jgi:membrane protein
VTCVRRVLAVLRSVYAVWNGADGARLGAAIAFYSTLSLTPFLLLVVGIAALFLGGEDVRVHLAAELTNVVGPAAASFVDQLLAHGATARGNGWVAAIGIATMLVGATATFTELRGAVAAMFGEPSDMPLVAVLRTRVLALALAVGTGFLLVVSLVASAAVSAALGWIGAGSLRTLFALGASELLTFAIFGAAFTILIKLLPTRHPPWRAAAVGGATAAALFTLGKYGLAAYIGRVASTSAFGASAALVVIMLWVYYSTQMFLAGAALARVCAEGKSLLWSTAATERRMITEH